MLPLNAVNQTEVSHEVRNEAHAANAQPAEHRALPPAASLYTYLAAPPSPQDMHHAVHAQEIQHDLHAIIRDVAQNVTDQNIHDLTHALNELGVQSAQDLKALMSTAQKRDSARSIAAALFVYTGSFGVGSLAVGPAVATAGAPWAAPGAALATASVLNPTMQGVAARGQLGARYNPLPPPNDSHVSFSGRRGAAMVNDLPFENFITAVAVSNTLSSAAVSTTNYFGAGAIRAGTGALAAMATGRQTRATLEGIETHAGRRAGPENGGYLKPQKWLDANELEKTKTMVKTLQQSSPRAIIGYTLDAVQSLRFVPSEFAGAVRSPRTYGNALAVMPAALLAGFKPMIQGSEWKVFTQMVSDIALIAGWQYRNQITHRISCGNFTEANARTMTNGCHDALATRILRLADRAERGEHDADAQQPPTPPGGAINPVFVIENETQRNQGRNARV